MRYENFGPVANPDGTPTDMTRAMLAGTGRDPVTFAARAGQRWAPICQSCYEVAEPNQYYPEATGWDQCAACLTTGMVVNVHPEVIQAALKGGIVPLVEPEDGTAVLP